MLLYNRPTLFLDFKRDQIQRLFHSCFQNLVDNKIAVLFYPK